MTGPAMERLIESLPWITGALILVLLTVAAVVGFVLYLVYKFKAHYKKGEFYFEGRDPHISMEKEYLKDTIILEIQKSIDKIMFRDLHSRRMNIVRHEVQQWITKMREYFLNLTINVYGDDVGFREDSVREYRQITTIIQSWMIEHLEQDMISDNFSTLQDREFKQFIEKSADVIFTQFGYVMDNGFRHGKLGLSELQEQHQNYRDELVKSLTVMYVEAEIARMRGMSEVKGMMLKIKKIQDHYLRTREVLMDQEGCTDV